MAYAALVSLAQTLDQFLVRHQHLSVDHREKKHIQSLHEKIVFLSTFLEEFPREATKLEARITVAANQVVDIFELHILNKNNGSKDGNLCSNVLNCFPLALFSGSNLEIFLNCFPLALFSGSNLENLYEVLQKPMKEIDSILKEAMEIKSSSCTNESQMMLSLSSISISSTLAPKVEGTVVGFEEVLLEIKERIYGESANLEVIPIFGMGGIGKTTLARYALHDPLARQRFHVSAFVSVSQNYDKASVLLCLLNSIDPSSKGIKIEDESLIHERVYKYLKGRRFLIVIDDIWNTKTWDDLRRAFPDDFNWSRIIITTRDVDVASYADTRSHSYGMHLMGVDLSWNLLRQKVFGEENCPLQLVEIGREIAQKCRGLPLAIVVIAGVLSKLDRMQRTWKKIAINVNEAVNTSDEPFTEILSLSYTYMPHYLRPCFLYMGVFPEDHDIHVSKLIRLWVAEGFLKSNGSKDLEEIAEDYLEDLAKRSLVLINKKRYDGKIKSIKMHDLLRDLCLRKAHEQKFLRVIHESSYGFPEGIENSRRLSILSYWWGHFRDMDNSPIHTLLVFGKPMFSVYPKCCGLLRVAKLKFRFGWDEIVDQSLHLRYLDFTCTIFSGFSGFTVPKSFSKLGNLQTLIINDKFYSPIHLPLEIWRMRELRHIIIFQAHLPEPSADQILPLKLQTLKCIEDFRCSERILKLIPNLKKLGIHYSYYDNANLTEYGLNNLIHLQKLEKLRLKTENDFYSESIAFPVTLKKLTLVRTGIPWEDMSIVSSLPNLQVLKLEWGAFRGFTWKTIEGHFYQLKVLLIQGSDPHDWITESSHFPRLERLILSFCYKLKEIPEGIGEIATLQLIEIDECNSSVVESAKNIEEEQRSYGNELQLEIVQEV